MQVFIAFAIKVKMELKYIVSTDKPWVVSAPKHSWPQTGATVHLSCDDPKHTTKILKEWLRDNSECPRVAQPEPRLQSHWTSLEGSENCCAPTLPSSLMELERFCKEEWAKLAIDRCARLVASNPKIIEAVIAAKGATKSFEQRLWIPMYILYLSSLFLINLKAFNKKLFSCCVYGVYCV